MTVTLIALTAFLLIWYIYQDPPKESFEQKRTVILSELSVAIGEAKSQGKYDCCIEPPCTMCYLGEWIWKDGICRCDEMILKGELDKVCPQCKEGVSEGKCTSTNKNTCSNGIFNASLEVLK